MPRRRRHGGGGWSPRVYPYPALYPVESPVYVDASEGSCGCKSGNQIEQKIKENPLLFVLGALAVGYFIAKR